MLVAPAYLGDISSLSAPPSTSWERALGSFRGPGCCLHGALLRIASVGRVDRRKSLKSRKCVVMTESLGPAIWTPQWTHLHSQVPLTVHTVLEHHPM